MVFPQINTIVKLQVPQSVISQNVFMKQIDIEVFDHCKCCWVVEQNPETTKSYAT